MKKLIMFSFLAILVSCSTSETPEVVPPPLTGNDAIFVANVLGKHTILNIEYTVGADGNILIGDVITYYFFIASSETEAYYTTPAKTEYLGVSIVTHEDGSKELKIYKKDRVEFWLDYIDIKLTTNHDISTAGVDIFVITHNTKTIIINGTSYTMSANTGHLENGGNTAYQYAGFKTEHQAYYRDATSEKYLGVAFKNGVDLQIFKKDRLDLWNTKAEVSFTTANDTGAAATDIFVITHNTKTIIINGTSYTMSANTGHLENGGNTAYQYAGFKTEHQAYYRDATSEKYLGVAFKNGVDLQIFKKDRLDLWNTKAEISFTTPHEVGYIDLFIKIHGGTEVTIDGSRYIVDSTTGNLGNAFTFVGQFNDDRAYYRQNPDQGYLGISILKAGEITIVKIYKKERTTLWTSKGDVLSITDHEVGYTPDDWGKDWTKLGDLPITEIEGDQSRAKGGGVVVLKDGNTILLGGGVNTARYSKIFLESSDTGKTWTSFTATFPEGINGVGNNDRALVLDSANYFIFKAGAKSLNVDGAQPDPVQGKILKSTDKGRTWTLVTEFPVDDFIPGFNVVYIKDSANGVDAGFYIIGLNAKKDSATAVTSILYSADGVSWTQSSAMTSISSSRADFVTVNNGTDMYVMGGAHNDGKGSAAQLKELWKSIDGGKNWEQVVTVNMWSARERSHAVVIGNDIFVFGGSVGGNPINDIWKAPIYDLGNWTKIANNAAWDARLSGAAFYDETTRKLYILGGQDNRWAPPWDGSFGASPNPKPNVWTTTARP